jgi:hypothetical protein
MCLTTEHQNMRSKTDPIFEIQKKLEYIQKQMEIKIQMVNSINILECGRSSTHREIYNTEYIYYKKRNI